jgi:hypothetical protein
MDNLLRERWADFVPPITQEPDAPTRVRAWSVGCVLGNETLVQSRPVVRDESLDFLDDFLRTAAPCTLGLYATTREASRPDEAAATRFQRWVGAASQNRLLDGPAALESELRKQLRDEVPAFLARSLLKGSDDELLFFSFLSRLHKLGGLGSAYAPAELIRGALSQLSTDLRERLGDDYELNMMVYDGRSFAMLHRGGTLTRWQAPEREVPRHRTGPMPAANIPRGSSLLVLSRVKARDPGADPLPDGVFSIDPSDPHRLQW